MIPIDTGSSSSRQNGSVESIAAMNMRPPSLHDHLISAAPISYGSWYHHPQMMFGMPAMHGMHGVSMAYPHSLYSQDYFTAAAAAISNRNSIPSVPAPAQPPVQAPPVNNANQIPPPPPPPSSQDNTPSPSTPYARRMKLDYPWLVVIGDACHSEKQTASGSDLSTIKRKYKKMYCSYCAEFNSSTPWAQLKPRKFEKESFAEHEKSAHHAKAVAARESLFLNKPSDSNEPKIVSQATSSNNGTKFLDAPALLATQNIMGNDFLPQNQFAWNLDNFAGIPVPAFHQLPLHHSMLSVDTTAHQQSQNAQNSSSLHASSSSPNLSGNEKDDEPQQFFSDVYTALGLSSEGHGSSRKRMGFAPDWVQLDGKLRFSDKQIHSGKDLSKVKKKYKMLMCTVCAEFLPGSAWATMRPRKFETGVFQEHERSINHKKAVDLKAAQQHGQKVMQMDELKMDQQAQDFLKDDFGDHDHE